MMRWHPGAVGGSEQRLLLMEMVSVSPEQSTQGLTMLSIPYVHSKINAVPQQRV